MNTTDRTDKWRSCASAFRDLYFDQRHIGDVDLETAQLAEQLFRGLIDLETFEAGDE